MHGNLFERTKNGENQKEIKKNGEKCVDEKTDRVGRATCLLLVCRLITQLVDKNGDRIGSRALFTADVHRRGVSRALSSAANGTVAAARVMKVS